MKILLVQTSFLGDTILSTPVISGLKQLFPTSELWVLTTPVGKEVLERDPLLDGVVVYDKRRSDRGPYGVLRMALRLRKMGFDCVYSLHRSFRTALLLWLSRIPVRIGFSEAKGSLFYTRTIDRLKGSHDVLRNLSLLVSDQDIESFEGEIRLYAPEFPGVAGDLGVSFLCEAPYVALVPGSAWKTKMWKWQGYRELASRYLSDGQRVVVLGSPDEREIGRKVAEGLDIVNLVGKTSVSQLMSLIKQASLVVCNDSMALHLASGFKVPGVAIFCATSPEFGFGPWRNRATVVQRDDLECKPCRRHGGMRCPTGTELCMSGVSVQDVYDSGRELLDA